MRSKICALFLILTSLAPNLGWGAIFPNAACLIVGGRYFYDCSSNLIILYCSVTTAGHYGTCRKSGSSSGYAVTSGKNYTIYAAYSITNGSAGIWNLGYGNTDVGLDSASAPTTPVYIAGGSVGIIGQGIATATQGQGGVNMPAIDFPVPAAKFPVMFSNAANNTVEVFGYEQ